MSGTPPRAVADLLPTALPQLEDHLVAHRVRARWAALVGVEVARRSRPTSFVGGTVTVTVDNSPWLHELTLRADDLAGRVRERFPAVRALRFTLGALDPESPAELPRRRKATPLSATDHAEIEAATAAVPDPTLAEALRRLMTKAWRFPVTRDR